MKIKITMTQGGYWMEIHVPSAKVSDQLSWLKEYVQPHAVMFPGGIWDEINGWREKTLTSEYYHKYTRKTELAQQLSDLRKQMETSLYSQQQHLFQKMMSGDAWIQRNLFSNWMNHTGDVQHEKQREAAQWGTMGLLRPPLNQLSAFQNDLGA